MFDWNYWYELFEVRARTLAISKLEPNDRLTAEERGRIADSIGIFQLGEQSEGRTLLLFAERFARLRGIPALPAITALFIREEQHHAAQLREFMNANGIALKRRSWTDSIFRRMRKLAGYEAAVTILVTAEMIGFVYYRALGCATDSRGLRSICREMCADESVHLRYETQLLRMLRGQRGRFARGCVEFGHRALLSIAARIVFRDHRRVLQYVGYDAPGFVRDCESIYRMVMRGGARRTAERTAVRRETRQ